MSLWSIAKIERENEEKTIKIAEMKQKVSKGHKEIILQEMKFQMAW